jgi:hypothetical protein
MRIHGPYTQGTQSSRSYLQLAELTTRIPASCQLYVWTLSCKARNQRATGRRSGGLCGTPGACARAEPAEGRGRRASVWMWSGMGIKGSSSRSHGSAEGRQELGLGWPKSTHRWTGITCRAASPAYSDWREETDVGWFGTDGIKGSRDMESRVETDSNSICTAVWERAV